MAFRGRTGDRLPPARRIPGHRGPSSELVNHSGKWLRRHEADDVERVASAVPRPALFSAFGSGRGAVGGVGLETVEN